MKGIYFVPVYGLKVYSEDFPVTGKYAKLKEGAMLLYQFVINGTAWAAFTGLILSIP